MDDVLEAFIEEAETKGYVLGYSLDSLGLLEAYIIEKNTSTNGKLLTTQLNILVK